MLGALAACMVGIGLVGGATVKPSLLNEEIDLNKNAAVPPEQRSSKGLGSDPKVKIQDEIPGHFDQKGATGTSSKTPTQGDQQDR
jgi:hypothetical protein